MNKKIVGAVGSIIIIAGGLVLIANLNQRQSSTPIDDKKETKFAQAPNFSLPDYSGETVSLTDFSGKNLVINSWASWCPFCGAELFDFAAAQQQFGDQVVIIAVNRAESLNVAKKFSDEVGASSNLVMLLDPNDSFYQSIGGFSMPETIFVNANGEIVFHKRGPMDLDEIRQRIHQSFNF
jgi:thiol-disulfide isomerase/thioredoxin